MKRVLPLIVLFSLLCVGLAKADSPPDMGSSPVGEVRLDSQQVAQLREVMGVLAKATGVKADAPPAEKQKSVAEVADKALDMFGSAITMVAGRIEQVAPLFWRVMVRQQYAKAAADLIPPFAWLMAALIIRVGLRKWWPVNPEDGGPNEFFWHLFTWFVPLFCLTLGTVFFVTGLSDSIKYIINPEYYAVKDVLLLVMNPAGVN